MEIPKIDYNYRMAPARLEMCTIHYSETVVTLSTGDVTSGLVRPLAAGIDTPPLLTNEKSHVTRERCGVDHKFVLNTKRKPWSLCRSLTSFPVSGVTELVK
jgi:hypothetical protein